MKIETLTDRLSSVAGSGIGEPISDAMLYSIEEEVWSMLKKLDVQAWLGAYGFEVVIALASLDVTELADFPVSVDEDMPDGTVVLRGFNRRDVRAVSHLCEVSVDLVYTYIDDDRCVDYI